MAVSGKRESSEMLVGNIIEIAACPMEGVVNSREPGGRRYCTLN